MVLSLPWILLFVLAAFFAFVVASTFGIGGPILLLPILMLRLPPAQAIAMIAPIMLFNNLLKLWLFRQYIQVKVALLTGLTALPAALLAATFTGRVDARYLQGGIALIIVASLLRQYAFREELKVSNRGLVGWGVIIGGISGFAGSAGPPTAVAIKGHGLMKKQFVGTVALLQFALQLIKIPTYVRTGIFPTELWLLTLLLSAVAVVAVLFGWQLIQKMQVHTYRLSLDGLLLLIAVWMIGSAITG